MVEEEGSAFEEQVSETGGSRPGKWSKTSLSPSNHLARAVWNAVWMVLCRPSPRRCHGWRRMFLRLFGARMGKAVIVYPSCKIWAPWNLVMEDGSCLGPDVDCYSVATITLGRDARVSQYSYLCTASHDCDDLAMPLVTAPITIGAKAWVCADVFIGPGVMVGEGAVVGARASVFKDVEPWTVVVGNPARFLRNRSGPAAAQPSGTMATSV
jgi:putative colanic acid biosynthesis acetyltransferase WcaF